MTSRSLVVEDFGIASRWSGRYRRRLDRLEFGDSPDGENASSTYGSSGDWDCDRASLAGSDVSRDHHSNGPSGGPDVHADATGIPFRSQRCPCP